MDKRKAYADIVESFINGGGREPYWEEAFAWSMGYQMAFDIARKQIKDGLELDAEPDFRPDNDIMKKNFAELDAKKSRVSEDTSDES
jgi:hypothetical protein